MKKWTVIGLALLVVFFGFFACKKAGIPVAGSARAEDMLTLIPKDARGIVVIDVHRAMTTEFIDKTIKESPNYQKYQEFIKETGIDPQKDIFFASVGIMGELSENVSSGVGVINMKFNKDSLLAKIKEKQPNLTEQAYEGLTMISMVPGENEKPVFAAFLDESNIALGTENGVKAVIDILKKKADSVLKNTEMAGIIKSSNKKAMVWCAFAFPPDMMKKLVASNPMLASLEGLKSLAVYFDYKNKALQAEIKGIGGDADKNKQIADFLTGLKALGGMASAEKPEIGQLMNKIEVSSAPEYVKIYVDLPEDLLNKLSAAAKQQVEGIIKPEAKEEGKEEIKKEETKKEEIKKDEVKIK
jgi:hypothetical protein